MLHQIKTPQFYTDLGLRKTVLNPFANGKIQGLFKAFECFSSTFQGKFESTWLQNVLFFFLLPVGVCIDVNFNLSLYDT